jgi:hypothetical protein
MPKSTVSMSLVSKPNSAAADLIASFAASFYPGSTTPVGGFAPGVVAGLPSIVFVVESAAVVEASEFAAAVPSVVELESPVAVSVVPVVSVVAAAGSLVVAPGISGPVVAGPVGAVGSTVAGIAIVGTVNTLSSCFVISLYSIFQCHP